MGGAVAVGFDTTACGGHSANGDVRCRECHPELADCSVFTFRQGTFGAKPTDPRQGTKPDRAKIPVRELGSRGPDPGQECESIIAGVAPDKLDSNANSAIRRGLYFPANSLVTPRHGWNIPDA